MISSKFKTHTKTPIAFKSRKEMAAEFGLHRDTFRKLLKMHNIVLPSGLINPKDQRLVREVLAGGLDTPSG